MFIFMNTRIVKFALSCFVLAIALTVTDTTYASRYNHNNFTPGARNCYWVGDRIDDIDTRMRNGYSGRHGEYLKEDRRELQKMRAMCRKKRFKTKRT